jgi:hypothetical protein
VKKTNYASSVKAKHLENLRGQHIYWGKQLPGAPCLQRIKVHSEKLRILLLLWFLLCGGGAHGKWPKIMPKKQPLAQKSALWPALFFIRIRKLFCLQDPDPYYLYGSV